MNDYDWQRDMTIEMIDEMIDETPDVFAIEASRHRVDRFLTELERAPATHLYSHDDERAAAACPPSGWACRYRGVWIVVGRDGQVDTPRRVFA